MQYQLLEELRKEYGDKFLEVLFKLYVVHASGRDILKLTDFENKDIVITLHPHFVYIHREYDKNHRRVYYRNEVRIEEPIYYDYVIPKQDLIEFCKRVLPEWLNLNEKINYLVNKYSKKLLSFVFWHLIKDKNVLFDSTIERISKYIPIIKELFNELEKLKLLYFYLFSKDYFILPDLIEKIRSMVSRELAIKEATILFLLMEMESMSEYKFKELLEQILNGKFEPRMDFSEEYQQYFYSIFKSELEEKRILIGRYLIWDKFIKWLREKIENIKKEFESENIDEKLYQIIIELGYKDSEKKLLEPIFGEICTKEQFERFANAIYQIFHEKLRNKIKNRIREIDIIRNYFAHEKYENTKDLFRDLCRKILNKYYPENSEDWKILANYIKFKILEKLK